MRTRTILLSTALITTGCLLKGEDYILDYINPSQELSYSLPLPQKTNNLENKLNSTYKNLDIEKKLELIHNKLNDDYKEFNSKDNFITVDIENQKLYLANYKNNSKNNLEIISEYKISSSKYGTGFANESNTTPTGTHFIEDIVGDKTTGGRIIKDGKLSNQYLGSNNPNEDIVSSIRMRLSGLDSKNINSWERLILIHGTNHENKLGIKDSNGCIRMSNSNIIDLYSEIKKGTLVYIF